MGNSKLVVVRRARLLCRALFGGLFILSTALSTGVQVNVSAAKSTDPKPAFAIATKWMPTDLFNLVFPTLIKLEIAETGKKPSLELLISDVIYAGKSTNATTAKLIGVAFPKDTPNALSQNYLAPTDLSQPLQVTADRIMGQIKGNIDSPPWIAVLELETSWEPWKLTIRTKKSVIAINPQATVSPSIVSIVNSSAPTTVRELNTSSVWLPLYKSTPLEMSVAVSFKDSSIVFGLIPKTLVSFMPLPGDVGYEFPSGQLPDTASAGISLPYSLLNFIFIEKYEESGVFVGNYNNKRITIFNPKLVGLNGGFDFTGDLDPKVLVNPEVKPYDPKKVKQSIMIQARGDDARFDIMKALTPDCQETVPSNVCSLINFRATGACVYMSFKETGKVIRPETVLNLGTLESSQKKVQMNLVIEKLHGTVDNLILSGHLSMAARQ